MADRGIKSRAPCLSQSGQPGKEREKDCEEESWVGAESDGGVAASDTSPARGHAQI